MRTCYRAQQCEDGGFQPVLPGWQARCHGHTEEPPRRLPQPAFRPWSDQGSIPARRHAGSTRRQQSAPRCIRRAAAEMGRMRVRAGSAGGDVLSPTRAKATALMVVLQLVASTMAAQTQGVDTLFPAQPVGYVNDFAGLLDPSTEAELEALVQRLKAATGAEVVVATLPSIGEREAPEVALAIGRRWEVGAKADPGDPRRNAGLVLLVVPRQNHQPGTGTRPHRGGQRPRRDRYRRDAP